MFYINNIELNEFLGFTKPRIKNIKIDILKKLIILNSSNGSGKSSSISELNPFPINKSLFDKDGYKKITFTYNDNRYLVYSSHKTNKLIDLSTDTNLNTGGTKTQHLDLIATMFGITPFKWDVCMGRINFTDSDKNIRRMWIELISGIDFNYPFNIYKKVVKLKNESRGAHKMVSEQLVSESRKVLGDKEINELISIKNDLSKDLKQVLLVSKAHDIPSPGKLKVDIRMMERRAEQLYRTYYKADTLRNKLNVGTLEELKALYNEAVGGIKSIDLVMEEKLKYLEEESKILYYWNGLIKDNLVDMGEVDRRIKWLDKTVTHIRGKVRNNSLIRTINIDNYKKLPSILESYKDRLTHYYLEHNLSNEDTLYKIPRKEYTDKLNLYNEYTQYNKNNDNLIKDLECRIDEINKEDTLECPKCTYEFKLGGHILDGLKSKLTNCYNYKEELSSSIKALTPDITDYTTASTAMDGITHLSQGILDGQYCTLLMDRFYKEDGLTLSEMCSIVEKDIEYFKLVGKGFEYKKELDKLSEIMKQHKLISDFSNPELLSKRVKSLEDDIARLRSEKKVLNDKVDYIDKLVSQYNDIRGKLNDLIKTIESLDKLRDQYIECLGDHLLNKIERDISNKLSTVTKQVNDNDIIGNLVKELESMSIKASSRYESLIVLEKALNPSTGIIAEQLTGYVECFTRQLVEVISSIWSYPLIIKPCLTIDKGMDYKFPFNVGGKDIQDIGLGSKSQKSVINLAIMFCTRVTLNLNDLPLYLDEVGNGFDHGNDAKLGKFLQDVLHSYNCSNVFLVHHNQLMRESLGESQVISFDPDNVVITGEYNRGVRTEYYQ
jgi:hypothetical protein